VPRRRAARRAARRFQGRRFMEKCSGLPVTPSWRSRAFRATNLTTGRALGAHHPRQSRGER
jgi:hypothetical protein